MGGNRVFKPRRRGRQNFFVSGENQRQNRKMRKIPNRTPISKKILEDLYLRKNKSIDPLHKDFSC